MKEKRFMNPYMAGFYLGLVLLLTFYIAGRGLGASGAVKSVAMQTVKQVAPTHYQETEYYQNQEKKDPKGPLHSWLLFEIVGVIMGAFVSGVVSKRIGFRINKGKHITTKTRFIFAALGGLLFGFGAQLGRGCTSGSALSGMAVMSFGGIITMMAIFGGAYAFAWFGRNLWKRQ